MKGKEFTTEWFTQIQKETDAALKSVGERYGIEMKAGKISYIPGLEFTMSLKCRKMATANFDPQKEDWCKRCQLYGLSEDMYGKTIHMDGEDYQISGINPTARKNVIRIKRLSDDTEYITSAAPVKQALGVQIESSVSEPEKSWEIHAFMLGLKDVPFGAVFEMNGERYQICGVNPRARDYKVIGRRLKDGKQFTFLPEAVKTGLLSQEDTKE